MKVLIINSFYFPDILGGAEISVKKLAENMALYNNEVHILCTSSADKTEIINKVNIHRMKINNLYHPIQASEKKGIQKILYRIIDYINLFNYSKVKMKIKEIKPDVIHTNNLYGISPIVWIVANQLKIPIVHTVRDYNLINVMNGSHFNKDNSYLYIINKFHKKIQSCLLKKINCVTGPSKAVLNRHKEVIGQTENLVVYNSIDFEKEKLLEIQKAKQQKKSQQLNYCFVGTLDHHKGVMDLIKAFELSNLHNASLHIAGKGPLEQNVLDVAEKNNNIIFHGFLKEEELSRLLLQSDCLIAPSKWEEPFGRVVLDAYKHLIPVIVSNKGGLPEIVKHMKTGLVIEPTVTQITNALYQVKELIKEEKVTQNIISKIEEFSLNSQTYNFKMLYKKVVKKNEYPN
ncbi:glycosyltransferase [Priestia aryabhattai]|uniref:glycosyltransferase n=1 Tax=Priestia aryabhattai TaxID=412384 RepID=UPI002E22A04F|nr:glycosyltransferase [Priestia aryabhattai]MED3920223.1 glycosyltransferase [Priestia aryabhattai]